MGDWIEQVIDAMGPVGVGLLIALENLIPPVPSEVVLPLAGYRASEGALNPILTWVAATAGALAGALILYALGAWLGYERLHRLAGHRWFIVASQKDVNLGCRVFEKHGSWIVAVSRCVPVIRSLVSIPAGIVRMPMMKFCVLTTIGTGIWNALFIWLGWALAEKWQEANRYLDPVGLVVIALLVVGLVLSAVRRQRQERLTAGSR